MTKFFKLQLLAFPLLLVACGIAPVSAPVVVAPVGPAAIAEDAAQTKQIADLKAANIAKEAASQNASGEVYGVKVSNQHNPDGTPKELVSAFADAAAASLPPVLDTQKALKDAQATRALAGELNAVKEELGAIAVKAQADAKARKEAEARIALQDSELTKLRENAVAEQEKNRLATQAAFDKKQQELTDARNALNDAVKARQVVILNWIGVACFGIFALGAGFGQLAGIKLVWPFALFSVMAFGLAQLVSQWWIKYAAGAAVVVGGIAVGYWLWHQHQECQLKVAAQQKVTQLGNALGAVVPVLDEAYNQAEPALKETLDKNIFDPLSKAMDKATKSVIHLVRSQDPVTAPTVAVIPTVVQPTQAIS